MFPLPSWAIKTVVAVLVSAALIGGALWYRGHVYDQGYARATSDAKTQYDAALAQARADDKRISDKAEADLLAKLKDETNAHKDRQAALEAALAAVGADNVRLSAELVRLHDLAVTGGRPGTPAAPSSPGETTDPTRPTPTLADLMLNDEINYTICRKNSAQLQAIQDWYLAIRNGGATAADQAAAGAPQD